MNELLNRITQIPGQCGGRPCIRGMRIRVSDILEMLAENVTVSEILEDFPDLEPEDIQACLVFIDITFTKQDEPKFSISDISCPWHQLDDEQFEQLCYDIITKKHHPIEIHKIGKSRSRDGGRDIVFYKPKNID